jgi:hypothetical protein
MRNERSDVARFVMAFLNGGELDGERILSTQSVAMMSQEGHVAAKGGPASFYKGVRHGLGWWIWPDGDRRRIMHSGDGPGFSNIMQLYPEEPLHRPPDLLHTAVTRRSSRAASLPNTMDPDA